MLVTPRVRFVHLASALVAVLAATPAGAVTSSLTTGFNGTAIPAGRTIWFSNVFKYSGPTSSPAVIDVTGGTITFTANATNYSQPVPNSHITLSPSATQVTRSFDTGSNTWNVTAPFNTSGNLLLGGVGFPVPVNFPGGVRPVTWTADFASATPGASINWQFAAAVYTTFSTDLNALNVKATDDNSASDIHNSDHAGTPEAFKSFVTGGAMGGGGSNFTGSLSPTGKVTFGGGGGPCTGGDFTCQISGHTFVHTGDTETYTVSSNVPGASVCSWSLSGNGGTIQGPTTGNSIKVKVNGQNNGYGLGTLSVTCRNGSCSSTCTLEIKVVPQGVNP